MPSSAIIYKSIKTTKALECLQDMVLTGNPIEMLGFSVSSFAGDLDPDRTLDDLNPTWYPISGNYTPFFVAPSRSDTTLTFIMQIPAGVTNNEVYMTEMYIYAKYKEEVFLFGIGQTQINPPDFRYIPNTTYKQIVNFDLTQYTGNLNVIITQANGVLVEAPLNLDTDARINLLIDDTLAVRDTKLGIPSVTNFIANKVGTASATGSTLTLPEMTLYTPDGRDNTNNVLKSTINTISSANYDLSSYDDDTYYLFYNSNLESVHLTTQYNKHVPILPEDGEFGQVVYTNDNKMHVIESVNPNYVLSGDTTVSEEGIVSNLGTLSFSITEPFQEHPVFNLDFITGDDVTTLQSLFNTPYGSATISNGSLAVSIYSYAYQVEYHNILYTGSYTTDSTTDALVITLAGVKYYSPVETLAVNDIIYTDIDCTIEYGLVRVLDDTSITVSTIENLYSGAYISPYSGDLVIYTIPNDTKYYSKGTAQVGDTLYNDDTFQTPVGTVDSINAGGFSIEVFSGEYTLISSGTIYTYSLTGISDTYFYTNEPLASNVIVYSDDTLQTVFGTVDTIDTSLNIVKLLFTSTYEAETISDYIIVNLDGVYYYTQSSQLEEGTILYYNSRFNAEYGIISSVNSTTISLFRYNDIYVGQYTAQGGKLYTYTIGSVTIYSNNSITLGSTVYLDKSLQTPYGVVEKVSPTLVIIHGINLHIGYVTTGGTGYVPENLSIYSTPSLTSVVGTTTESNAVFTGYVEESPVNTITMSIEASTNYIGSFSFTGTEYILTLNGNQESINTNRTPYLGSDSTVVLGGVNDFLGTFNLNSTNLPYTWEWNNHNSTSPDWAVEPLCELGTITIEDGEISVIQLNESIEIAKFTDLGETKSSSSTYMGQTIRSSLPLINNKKVHLADGSLFTYDGEYKSFVKYVAKLYELGYTSFFTTESDWQEKVALYGICNQYVYNGVTGTLRIPKLCGISSGVDSINGLGVITPAGIPDFTHNHNSSSTINIPSHTHTRGTMNITGGIANGSLSSTADGYWGAIYLVNAGWRSGLRGSDNVRFNMVLDASRNWTGETSSAGGLTDVPVQVGNPTYTDSNLSNIMGRSNTVQPQTFSELVYIVVKD